MRLIINNITPEQTKSAMLALLDLGISFSIEGDSTAVVEPKKKRFNINQAMFQLILEILKEGEMGSKQIGVELSKRSNGAYSAGSASPALSKLFVHKKIHRRAVGKGFKYFLKGAPL